MPDVPFLVTEDPRRVGLDPSCTEKAFGVVRRFVEEGRIPGAVAQIGTAAGALRPRAFGFRQIVPACEPASPDTIFDCASLTKAVVTATLALLALEEGLFRLDDAAGLFVPEFLEGGPAEDREVKQEITIRQLLTHTSGLPAWAPLFESAGNEHDGAAGPSAHPAERIVRRLCRQPLAYRPGTAVVYSCLGFILLGEILRRFYGAPLDALARERIFRPLGMQDAQYCPPPAIASRIAATELVGGAPLVGVVHDENARAMGGVSGNAGLFATAMDLSRFAWMMLGRGRFGSSRFLSPAAVAEATRDHTGHLGVSRGLGWAVKGRTAGGSAGDLFSPESFGHTGFTGTSLWIDPARGLFAVLLTNRVHPSRDNDAHWRLRPLFHNAVAASW